MFLNSSQIQELYAIFTIAGLNIRDFQFYNNSREFGCCYIDDPDNIRLQIRKSIYGAVFGDVFCMPYTYRPSIYYGCKEFTECLHFAKEWALSTKYKLSGRKYYHKIFISHSSEDKRLIDEFIDKVLRLTCGFDSSEIIYTSRQSTGAELGESIPTFIKDNLESSSLVVFMISPNYRESEVCLNEMGAAWALEKNILSILLPNVPFKKLGWLTSFNKAIKIDDSESLDKLVTMLSRKEIDIADWNRQKESFLSFCKEHCKYNQTYDGQIESTTAQKVYAEHKKQEYKA